MTKGVERRLAQLFSSEEWAVAVSELIEPEMRRLLEALDASTEVREDDKLRGQRRGLRWILSQSSLFAKKGVDNSDDTE